jgi:hypothetical protein
MQNLLLLLSVSPDVLPTVTPAVAETTNQVQSVSWHLDWGTVVAGIVAGVAAGAVVVIMQVIGDYLLQKFVKLKESRARVLVTFPHDRRFIDGRIFEKLKPGRSVEYMKTALGAPAMTSREVAPIFTTDTFYNERYEPMTFESEEAQETYSEEYHSTTAYVYQFENAIVKITSKDKEVIDSLAVEITGDDGSLNVPQLPLGWSDDEDNLQLGKSIVTKDLVEECQKFSYEFSRFEHKIVLCLYTASPLYTYYSYFGYPNFEGDEPDAEKPETFVGGTINGICLHSDECRCYIVRHWDYE